MAQTTEMLPLEISVHEVKALVDANASLLLVDCREDDEYQIAKIEGAMLIPMSQFLERLGELEAARAMQLVVHCHHGGRSLRVAHALRSRGFERAQSMAGGIDTWSQEIDTNVPRY